MSCSLGKRQSSCVISLLIALRSFLLTASFVTTVSQRARHPTVSLVLSLRDNLHGQEVTSDTEDSLGLLRQDCNIRFSGLGRLYTDSEVVRNDVDSNPAAHLSVVERLGRATVAVIGVGGVGSWAAEALVRSGVGSVVLVDADDVCISNTNRQLHAMTSTVGLMKVDEMKRRLVDINPQCNVTTILDFISTDNVNSILDGLLSDLSVCLDAIDGAQDKSALLAACTERRIPIVTCGGAAGKRDPTQIVVDDLTQVDSDRLLAMCRKHLRQQHGFERGLSFQERQLNKKRVRKWGIAAVYSTEPTRSLPHGDDVSSFRRCDGALGTACFVTGAFGFAAAGRVIDMIANNKLIQPRKG